jgi:hypothetical protein
VNFYLLFGRDRTSVTFRDSADHPGVDHRPKDSRKVNVRARCVRRCLKSVEHGRGWQSNQVTVLFASHSVTKKIYL